MLWWFEQINHWENKRWSWWYCDQYKAQRMCDNMILENDGMLIFIPYCYKDKKCVLMLLCSFMLMH